MIYLVHNEKGIIRIVLSEICSWLIILWSHIILNDTIFKVHFVT